MSITIILDYKLKLTIRAVNIIFLSFLDSLTCWLGLVPTGQYRAADDYPEHVVELRSVCVCLMSQPRSRSEQEIRG